ncbi:MAG: hypothetical protein JWN12_15 [Candidatus Saccharibacteria bacterium]|nr:hypothetical protein [Candidatus Saccharibacteria bacterium]
MELSPKTAETYSGKKLIELLAFATSDLEPGIGFKLQLEGVHAIPVMLKELEAYFDASLDEQRGANIVLGYDDLTQKMVLDEFSFPLKGIQGAAKLMRTETLGYVPLIQVRNKQFDSRQEFMDYDQSRVLLAGFGIEDFSTYGTERYADWRDTVVSKTSAWQVTEKIQIPIAFDETSAQSITLSRSETIDLANFKMIQHNTITRSIISFHEDGSTDHSEMTLDSIKDLDQHDLPISLKTYRKTPDILADEGKIVSHEHTQMLPLSHNNFTTFQNALQEIIHQHHAT